MHKNGGKPDNHSLDLSCHILRGLSLNMDCIETLDRKSKVGIKLTLLVSVCRYLGTLPVKVLLIMQHRTTNFQND